MAFPSVRSVNKAPAAGSTGISLPMPATIVAGDLLLAVIQLNTTGNLTSNPTGFTLVTSTTADQEHWVFAKVAVGSDTATFDLSAVQGVAMVVVSIQDWEGTLAGVEGLVVTGTNPPSASPSWGAEDTLWVETAGAAAGTLPAVSAWSTGYTEIDHVTGDFGTDVAAGMASRAVNTATEDPDAITWTTGTQFRSATVAVRPAGAGFDPANLQTSVVDDDVTLTWDV